MKVIGVIPARYKSSRFPGKPLADICGKPMIWWVYQQVRKVSEFDTVVVATDDQRIKVACDNMKIDAIMTSDMHPTGTDRVAEVAGKIDGDLYVNIQGDEPLIEPESIIAVIEYFKAHQEVDVINTMIEVTDIADLERSSVVKVAYNSSNDVIYLSRSIVPHKKCQGDVTYFRHMGLYGMTKSALMFFAETPRGQIEKVEDIEMFRFIENKKNIKILPIQGQAIAVDYPEDIEKVKAEITREGTL